MGGMPGMGGPPGKSPFSKEKLEACRNSPKLAQYFKDPQFTNMFEMCVQKPEMLVQIMQMDPRFMDVFKELTGIDLGEMSQMQAEQEEQKEKFAEKAKEQQKKREAEEEARKKAEEEAALPSEAKAELQKKKDAEAKKLEGNTFYKQRNFEKAIELYSAAIELNPAEMTYYSNLAAVFMEQKEYDKAIAEVEKAIKLAENGPYDYVKMGKSMARKANCLFLKGEFDEAIEVYQNALLEHNDYNIKEGLKKVQKAKAESAAKAYINPEIAETHKAKGNDLFKAGDFPGAIKEFDEAIKRDPSNKAYYSNRSFAYIKLMEPTYALKDAEKAIELDPTFVKAWVRKATCHSLHKEYHKAMEAF